MSAATAAAAAAVAAAAAAAAAAVAAWALYAEFVKRNQTCQWCWLLGAKTISIEYLVRFRSLQQKHIPPTK